MNTETLRQIFKESFDYESYSNEIVYRLFGCNDVATHPELLDTNAEGDQCFFIGQMDDADHRLLGFFYTRMADGSDVRRKRVGLRKLISPYLKYDVDGAIAVFDDGQHWRLSYICDLKEGSTSAKRFSYILGDENGQYKTPLERLEKVAKLNGHLKLSDLKESFSVDALSDEFFDEYHIHYDFIVAELARQGKTGAILHDYVKKMMGRIVFLHFLQKKGWLNGNPTFLRDLFLSSPHQTDFLEQVLEPLFFGIFNTESEQREKLFATEHWDKGLLKQWGHLPYLNGGLFERDEVDKMNIRLPALLFNNLFAFLASYNFTVDENDPDDAEIGVDPEMLGKIFESLLEDNKAKGAFYTPKEIVRYMCKESLIAYLDEQCTMNDVQLSSAIRTFVENHELPGELEPYRDVLNCALCEVKICDPAIGSGAFPMGLLNELWRCREAIGTTLSRLQLKKEIIENNIYGVDIEQGAIDIARLRFWLSIVVDSDEPEALPNFDYKFMQGNSLIENFEGVDLSRMMNQEGMISRLGKGKNKAGINQLGLEFVSSDTKRNLQLMLRKYFSITDHVKKSQQRCSINESVKSYIRQLCISPSAEARLSAIDPSANQEFFLWHTWFKDIFDKGGFDIVIGNPPYLDYREIDSKVLSHTRNWELNYNSSRPNLYVYFVEQGINILNSKGFLTFINPIAMLATDYAYGIRNALLKKGSIRWIRDVSHIKVFADASTYVMMWGYSNSKKIQYIKVKQCQDYSDLESSDSSIIEVKDVLSTNKLIIPCSENSRLIKKIEQGKIELSSIVIIKWGTSATGYGKQKITENEYQFLTENGKNKYAPIIQTADIKRFYIDWQKEYIPKSIFSSFIIQEFKKRKIVIGRLTKKLQASIDIQQYYVGKSTVITDINKSYCDLFILALLNSKLINYWYLSKFETTHMAGGYIRFDIPYLKQMPIPKISLQQQQRIVNLVDEITRKKALNHSSNTSELEREIDVLVYELYGLTEEEIKVVEGKDKA